MNTWYKKLYAQDWFRKLVCDRWNELRSNPETDPASIVLPFINEFATTHSNEINRNRAKWYTDATTEYRYDDTGFWGDRGLSGKYFGGEKTYNTQKTGLYNWIKDRITFLDSEWSNSEWKLIARDDSGFTLDWGLDHSFEYDLSNYSAAKVVIRGRQDDGMRLYLEPNDGTAVFEGVGFNGEYTYTFTSEDMTTVKAILQGNPNTWTWITSFELWAC